MVSGHMDTILNCMHCKDMGCDLILRQELKPISIGSFAVSGFWHIPGSFALLGRWNVPAMVVGQHLACCHGNVMGLCMVVTWPWYGSYFDGFDYIWMQVCVTIQLLFSELKTFPFQIFFLWKVIVMLSIVIFSFNTSFFFWLLIIVKFQVNGIPYGMGSLLNYSPKCLYKC